MSNKTFIPAFRARVGDWDYYICLMKYAEVARQVGFAHELGGNKDLGTMIQRGISARTKEITDYLLKSEHRFLGALIVAVWGGEPSYTKVDMEDPDGMLSGLDREFGVLTFDGTQSYFALDGQHRLRAIKDGLKKDPELGSEDICVLLVSHYDTDDGREKTRRLFTNINRNAKSTTAAENIAIDEDDGFAIITRQLLNDHDLLKQDGVVRIFTRQGDEGELKLAGSNIPKTHKQALTTITVLYSCLEQLGFGLDESMVSENVRPMNGVLEDSYEILAKRIDDVLKACGDVRAKLESTNDARTIRAPKDAEETGHAFMRPVIQKAVAKTLRQLIDQNLAEWQVLMTRLRELDWQIGKAPWTAVFNVNQKKMLSGKENRVLLEQLLRAHLAPASKQEIKKARRSFKELIGGTYPFTEEQMGANLREGED